MFCLFKIMFLCSQLPKGVEEGRLVRNNYSAVWPSVLVMGIVRSGSILQVHSREKRDVADK